MEFSMKKSSRFTYIHRFTWILLWNHCLTRTKHSVLRVAFNVLCMYHYILINGDYTSGSASLHSLTGASQDGPHRACSYEAGLFITTPSWQDRLSCPIHKLRWHPLGVFYSGLFCTKTKQCGSLRTWTKSVIRHDSASSPSRLFDTKSSSDTLQYDILRRLLVPKASTRLSMSLFGVHIPQSYS